jgi:regulator of protease activity HflC (stomatin/prohibitin superfamily)
MGSQVLAAQNSQPVGQQGGLTPVVPGQARVVQLFGKYHGTIREPGLQWVNPCEQATQQVVSTGSLYQ